MNIADDDARDPDYCRGFAHGWREGQKAADASQRDFEDALEFGLKLRYPPCPTCGEVTIPDEMSGERARLLDILIETIEKLKR